MDKMSCSRMGFDLLSKGGIKNAIYVRFRRNGFWHHVWRDTFGKIGCWFLGHNEYSSDGDIACKRCCKYITKKPELKNCPCCGDEAEVLRVVYKNSVSHRVVCPGCGISTKAVYSFETLFGPGYLPCVSETDQLNDRNCVIKIWKRRVM